MKFRLYHDKGKSFPNPMEVSDNSVEEAVMWAEAKFGVTVYDASAEFDNGMWVAVDVWRN